MEHPRSELPEPPFRIYSGADKDPADPFQQETGSKGRSASKKLKRIPAQFLIPRSVYIFLYFSFLTAFL